MAWFSNRGQMIQVGIGVIQLGISLTGLLLALHNNWPSFKANDLSSPGVILVYFLTALVLSAIALLTNTLRAYIMVRKEQTSDTITAILAKDVRPGQKLPIPSVDFPTPDWLKPLTPVINKKYKNETVELDGREFQHCEFQEVTFLWNGTKPTRFVNCKMTGGPHVSFSSHNPLVFGTLQIVRSLEEAAGGQKAKVEWSLFDQSPR